MYSDQLVQRVNEVYHDVEGAAYQNLHPEIFAEEAHRWTGLAGRYLTGETAITVLDIGCGTGFVGQQFGSRLRPIDQLICADVSSAMLRVAESNLAKLQCEKQFIKLDDKTLPLESLSCDIITMNSVVHHVPDLQTAFGEIARILRPGGRVLIGHEPSKAYYEDARLRRIASIASWLFAPRQAIGSLLRRIGLIDAVRSLLRPLGSRDREYGRTLDEVNRILQAEGAIEKPLTQDQLTEIVDIHSPTAGGFHAGRGIDLPQLAQTYLPGFIVESFQTYNHLGDGLSRRNRLTRWADARLAGRHPHHGATLMAVLRKASGD